MHWNKKGIAQQHELVDAKFVGDKKFQLFFSFLCFFFSGDWRVCERKIEIVVEIILNETHQQTLFYATYHHQS